ncbi:ornithine carbamoyltransferase [Candidatus Magnetoovum chiemensis]|nr:ornithine carbamoyltransferase [Candidatus Magnetoovum chiemensis]
MNRQSKPKRDLLTVWNLTGSEIDSLINRAIELKKNKYDASNMPLKGKSLALIFDKMSTRTRLSFEVGIYQLGAQGIFIRPGDSHLGNSESVSDTAKVLSRYFDGVIMRTYAHERIEEFAKYADIPVINALTDKHHPCQVIADMMTIKEKKGALQNLRLTYIGDGNNIANSLIEVCAIMGINLTLATPEGYEPAYDILDRVRQNTLNNIIILNNPQEAASRADILYTDVWISMGDKVDNEHKKERFKNYQLNDRLLSLAKPDCLVMHCLPAHRGEEITDSVMDSPNSAVFDQAENRLHIQKAILEMIIT